VTASLMRRCGHKTVGTRVAQPLPHPALHFKRACGSTERSESEWSDG
jgi:hypothetical protein